MKQSSRSLVLPYLEKNPSRFFVATTLSDGAQNFAVQKDKKTCYDRFFFSLFCPFFQKISKLVVVIVAALLAFV